MVCLKKMGLKRLIIDTEPDGEQTPALAGGQAKGSRFEGSPWGNISLSEIKIPRP